MSPRNSSGSYSTPTPGVPFQSGQVINSANMNATLADLGAEISSSLDRQGRGPMQAPVRGVDGSVAAPAYSYVSETSTGWYRAAAGDLRLAIAGVDLLSFKNNVLTLMIAGNPIFQAGGANSALSIVGNKDAADTGTDTSISSSATRTAGDLLQIQNHGSLSLGGLGVDFHGLLRLGAQAAAIQPASIWTAITPGAGWTAGGGLGFWKTVDGIVYLKGNVLGSTGSAIFGTLPAGFRPGSTRAFSIPWSGTAPPAANDGFYFAQVLSNGTISAPVNSAGTTWYLDGVSFLAEA